MELVIPLLHAEALLVYPVTCMGSGQQTHLNNTPIVWVRAQQGNDAPNHVLRARTHAPNQ
jgi:hypothetical protein